MPGARATKNPPPSQQPTRIIISPDDEEEEQNEPTPLKEESSHEEPTPSTEELLAAIRELRQQVADLQNAQQQPSTPPPAEYAPHRDPKANSPTVFTGQTSKFRNYLTQCDLVFALCPHTYVTDE
jgi:hypothetical protein